MAAVVATVAVTAVLPAAWSPAEAAVTQNASCVDGGGVRWSSRAVWGSPYAAGDGQLRVVMDYAGWTTTRAGAVATDSAVRTYDGTGTRIQQLTWTGAFDYGAGTLYRVRNPLNPVSAPGKAKVTVTLGVDGDGFGDCTVSFVQPAAQPSPAPSTPVPSSGSVSDRYEADVLSATNTERTSRGLVALTAQACVDKYAEAQSQRMATENRMYHQDLGPILTDCRLSAVGENVAYGYPDGTAVTAAWMNSSGHRANILNSRYRLLGVGASQNAQGRWYVAQVFGA